MGGRFFGLELCVSAIALASATVVQAQESTTPDAATPAVEPAVSSPATPSPAPRRKAAMSFTVPLVYGTRAFGDILVEVGGADVAVETIGLRRELTQILNDAGLAALDQATAGSPFVTPADLAAAGFEVRFDSRQLQLELVSVRPLLVQTRTLGQASGQREATPLPVIAPAGFSTYLNVTGNADYSTRFRTKAPDFFFDGATRIGRVVIEYDGALTDQFGQSYAFYRRGTRAVYDDPARYRRYSAGDLRLQTLTLMRTPQIGGIAVEKSRQIFDPYASVSRLAGRQIFLDNRATVDVLINGAKYDTFQLDAGTYDLASLPIRQGSNDVKLVINDSFGRRQVIDYNFFFETLALPAGQDEYSLGVGVLSDSLGFQPRYTGELAASGYYRRALSADLILGAALEASGKTQVLGATATVVPQFLPGVFDLELAGSRSRFGTGIAARAGYRFQMGSRERATQFTMNVDYQGRNFTSLGDIAPPNFDVLTVAASLSRSFGTDTYVVVGGNYSAVGGRARKDYNIFADYNRRLTNRIRFSVGAEYGQTIGLRRNFGVRAGISVALGARTRATADYRSLTDSFRASLSRGAENTVGSLGYDVALTKFGGDSQVSAQADYVGNRFAARASLSSAGSSLSRVFDDQAARLQLSTSFAYAGGSFGIGRPISNSFLLAAPNQAIDDQSIVTGRSLAGSKYYAASGPLGAAMQSDLAPYYEQSVQYDVKDAAVGFDVGDGIVRVDPPYKSGYKVVVGSDHFVSVIGTLLDGGEPVALAGGRVVALDEREEFAEMPFFTNTAGRFGLLGLAPGKRYEVIMAGSGRRFTIEVPAGREPVVRLGTVSLPSKQ